MLTFALEERKDEFFRVVLRISRAANMLLLYLICRGVLSIAWSLADPELLLSCGKDNRILCWNPNTAEVKCHLNAIYVRVIDTTKVGH